MAERTCPFGVPVDPRRPPKEIQTLVVCGAPVVEACGSCGIHKNELDDVMLTDEGGHIVWGAVPDHCGPFERVCTSGHPVSALSEGMEAGNG